MAAVGWMEVGEAVVGWMVPGGAVVECMGPGGPVVGWMEMGESVAGRGMQNAILQVMMHSTATSPWVPLVRWQAVGRVKRLVHQPPINAPVVGVERLRGIELYPIWPCIENPSNNGCG